MSRHPWLLSLFVLLCVAGCRKVSPKKPEQVALDAKLGSTEPRPCPGTASKVRDNCGCNPIDNSLITVVETLQINQNIKTRVQNCAQGKFGVDVTSAVIAKGDFQSCVTKDINIPPDVLAQLMAAIDQAMKDNERHQQELKSWLACYDIQTGVAAEKRLNPNTFSVGGETDKKPTSAPAHGADTTEIKDCDPNDFDACQKACEAGKAKSCTSYAVMLRKPGPTQDAAKAIAAYQKACEQNDPPACNSLGFMYGAAEGVPKDDKKAFSLFVKACDANLPVGCYNVGLNMYYARGATKDDKRSIELYQKACDGGYALACVNLGNMYKNGEGAPKDEAKALNLYTLACDNKSDARAAQGCDRLGDLYSAQKEYLRAITIYQKSCDNNAMTSCTRLGDMYINGKGVKADNAKGLSLYQKACDANESQACVNIGRMYAFAVGVPYDIAKARKLYQKACDGKNYVGCADLGRSYFSERGFPMDTAALPPLQKACENKIGQGCYDLAVLYQYGVSVEKDSLKASTLLLDACDLKYYRGCTLLGSWYEDGKNGLSQDVPAAIRLYQKGVDAKEREAFFALGSLYLDPNSTGKDAAKGVPLYQKACNEMSKEGEAPGCVVIGNLFMTGDPKLGVSQDVPRALSLFQKGCDFKDTYCCATLGGLYLLGERTTKDLKKAVDYYQKACDFKDARSCHALGLVYFNGTDVPKDATRATTLFARACELGNKESCVPPYKPEIGGM